MSFGYSVSDFVLLTRLAWQVVQNSRRACGAHDELTSEVTNLHLVLRRLEVEVLKPDSIFTISDDSLDRKEELAQLSGDCRRVLRVLDGILEKYNALSEEKRSVTKLWKKVKFGNGEMLDLAEIRRKISRSISTLTLFLNLLTTGSQCKVESYMESQGDELREVRRSLNWITSSMQANNSYNSVGQQVGSNSALGNRHFRDQDPIAIWDQTTSEKNSASSISRRRVTTEYYRTSIGMVILSSQTQSSCPARRISYSEDAKSGQAVEWRLKVMPSRFVRYGAEISLSRASSGIWFARKSSIQYELRCFPAVSVNAQIFEACKIGDIQWVQALFQRGEASPFDTDPEGWTPLHMAAFWKRADICELLIKQGADVHALTALRFHPLAMACIGARSAHKSVLDLVRIFVEIGGSDLFIQDEIGDDCLHHIRTIPSVSSYLRQQGRLPTSMVRDKFKTQTALNWAVYSCNPPEEIENLLELGADPRGLTTGFRNETGNVLHTAASTLNHLQGLTDSLYGSLLDARKRDNIVLLLRAGADIHVLDDQDCTPFDYLLEVVRKFRHRKGLRIWREALEACGIYWEEFLEEEKKIHTSRCREDYPAACDYYWSLQQQRDYWLSDKWKEESEERFFWDPHIMDYLPPYAVPGRYTPDSACSYNVKECFSSTATILLVASELSAFFISFLTQLLLFLSHLF